MSEEKTSEKMELEKIELEKIDTSGDMPDQPEGTPAAQASTTKKKSGIGLLITVLVVGAAAIFGWQSGIFTSGKKADMPVVYVKDDNLFVDDLKNGPYQVAEGLSSGGSYSYYYTAWGAIPSDDGKTLYYSDNISSDGRFDLYKRNLEAEEESTLIASQVINYQISGDGVVCAYLKLSDDETISLFTYDGNQTVAISNHAVLSEDSFQISENGKYIAYELANEDGTTQLAVSPITGGEETTLTQALVQFSVAQATGKVYYVGLVEDSYTIYEYTFGQEPVLVGNNAVAMEILGNGKDVMFCTQSSVEIKGSDILVDDMAEADAAVPTPDFGVSSEAENQAYDEKAARDEIRLALKDGSFESPMQDCYIWSNGKVETVDTEILNAKAAIGSPGYVLYSKIDTSSMEKIKLSQVDSLDEAKYMYYVNLSGAPRKTYFAKAGGDAIDLNSDNIGADSFAVSQTGKRIAYDVVDALSGESQFFTATLGSDGALGELVALSENVDLNQFSGVGETLYWLEPTDQTMQEGTLMVCENGEKSVVNENVSGFRVAEDSQAVYYISDIDETTENGNLLMYENGNRVEIDKDVFCLQYKGNGKMVYMKNYSMDSQTGDLYYWDGKASRLIDQAVTAIFIF